VNYQKIIQAVLDTYTNKIYMEIGSSASEETYFASINANYKIALYQTPPSEQVKKIINDNCVYHRMSSGYYFNKVNTSDIKYDVIFANGSMDYRQVLMIVKNALEHLSFGGVLLIPIKIHNDMTQGGGNDWKAIATLGSFHSGLFIFTLDCDGDCGCIVITKAEPYSILSYSEAAVNSDNPIDYLNFKAYEYLNTFLMCRKYKERLNYYNLYVENINDYIRDCSRDCYIEETPIVSIIENGIILPKKWNVDKICGGVCDAQGIFITGKPELKYSDNNNDSRDFPIFQTDEDESKIQYFKKLLEYGGGAYTISNEIAYVNKTVVWGGELTDHYGHALLESLSRMWYFLENKDCGFKYAFTSLVDSPILDFHIMLGLRKEDIIIVNEPTRFDSVIAPEQSHYLFGGFNDKAMKVYNSIRDSVQPACYDKVYLTRTQIGDILNEEYFIQYYRSLGYEIISMERLPIKEQVAVMAGAKDVVCISGTLHHQILLCHNGVNVTVLNKQKLSLLPHYWINQARSAKCTFIDVSANLLPTSHIGSVYLFMPNAYWKRYIKNHRGDFQENDTILIDVFIIEYIKRWAEAVVNDPGALRTCLMLFGNSPLPNLAIDINKYLLNNEIDYFTKKRLKREWKTIFAYP